MWFIVEMYLGIHPYSQKGNQEMKRLAIFVISAILIFSTSVTEIFAAGSESGTASQRKVIFYLKPDICVELNGVRQVFKDANGQTVYPIVYNGTTYLPVRAVSALMKEPVEWDSGSKTVYIGKTLSYPLKTSAPIPKDAASPADEGDLAELVGLEPTLVTGYSKSDVLVMYDFEIQTFRDANGTKVFPLNFNGSTYLPIRAVSGLMDEPITWFATEKRICIGDGVEEEAPEDEDQDEEEDTEEDDDFAIALLKELFESEEALYYEASAKVSSIKGASLDERQAIAASASDNYLKAQSLKQEIGELDQDDFTESEKAACEKLLAFAESNEYYLLVLENIAYMAASDSDYSMLADTFLYFAMEAQTKMGEARKLIIKEPVYN